MRTNIITVILLLMTLYSKANKDSGYANINGLKMYYEVYGEGKFTWYHTHRHDGAYGLLDSYGQ